MSRLFLMTLLGVVVLFATTAISTSVLYAMTIRHHLTDEYLRNGRSIASSIADSSVEVLLNRDASTLQSVIDQFTEIAGISYVFIVDDEHEIIAHTFVPGIPPELQALARGEPGEMTDLRVAGRGDFTDVAQPILAGVAGYVHVGIDRGGIESQIRSAIVGQVLLICAIFLVSVLASYWLVNRIAAPIDEVSHAAAAVETGAFEPESLAHVAGRGDELGQLARVFQRMAREVYAREQRLKQQVQELQIEIDQAKKERQVAEITETEYFQDLQKRAKSFRNRGRGGGG
jgi:HAMP domain-containing protein